MIEYKNEKEKQILLFYAEKFSNVEAGAVLKRGSVTTAEDVKHLATLYWRMVDEADGDNMNYWLERIYTSLHIHVGNCGFEDVWDGLIPD